MVISGNSWWRRQFSKDVYLKILNLFDKLKNFLTYKESSAKETMKQKKFRKKTKAPIRLPLIRQGETAKNLSAKNSNFERKSVIFGMFSKEA